MTSGEQLKFDGIGAVLAASTAPHRVSYRDAAVAAIEELNASGRTWTLDDVHRLIPEDVEPHSPNTLPAIIASMSRRGVIVPDGWASSARPARRAGYSRRWRAACVRGDRS